MVVEAVRSLLASSAHEDLEIIVVYDMPTPPQVWPSCARSLGDAAWCWCRSPSPSTSARRYNLGALPRHGRAAGLPQRRHGGDLRRVPRAADRTAARARSRRDRAEAATSRTARVQHAGLVYGSGTITTATTGPPSRRLGAFGELVDEPGGHGVTGGLHRRCVARSSRRSAASPRSCRSTTTTSTSASRCATRGYRLVWLHDVELYHFESISRSNQVRPWEKDIHHRPLGDYLEVDERYSTNVR